MRERCSRCHKALDSDGSCRNCGFKAPAMVGTPFRPGEATELARQVRQRPPLSPKCRGRLHHLCRMSGCGCPCGHRGSLADALRREAAQLEHDEVEPDAAVWAEELRRRADEVES